MERTTRQEIDRALATINKNLDRPYNVFGQYGYQTIDRISRAGGTGTDEIATGLTKREVMLVLNGIIEGINLHKVIENN